MRFRKLRIAWSVVWGLAAVLPIVLWVRSYSRIDALRGLLGHERVFAAQTDMGDFSIWCVRYLNYQIPHSDAGFKAGSFARDGNGSREPAPAP